MTEKEYNARKVYPLSFDYKEIFERTEDQLQRINSLIAELDKRVTLAEYHLYGNNTEGLIKKVEEQEKKNIRRAQLDAALVAAGLVVGLISQWLMNFFKLKS